MICKWCGEPLQFKRGNGWVHQDGKAYKTYMRYPSICVVCGNQLKNGYCSYCNKQWEKIEVDDHCVFPIPEK